MADKILCADENLTRRDAITLAYQESVRLMRQVWVINREGYFLIVLPEALNAGDLLVHDASVTHGKAG